MEVDRETKHAFREMRRMFVAVLSTRQRRDLFALLREAYCLTCGRDLSTSSCRCPTCAEKKP